MWKTGGGDEGYTSLFGGERVAKESPRIEALGELDEATAAIGFARSLVARELSKPLLVFIQRRLYVLMAEVATPGMNMLTERIAADDVSALEHEMEALAREIPVGDVFVVPGDSPGGGALHVARTVVRRAERRVTALVHQGLLENVQILRFLNRLSALLYFLARADDLAAGVKEPTLMKE